MTSRGAAELRNLVNERTESCLHLHSIWPEHKTSCNKLFSLQKRQLSCCSLSCWTSYKNIYKFHFILIMNGKMTKTSLNFSINWIYCKEQDVKNLDYPLLILFQLLLLPTKSNNHVCPPWLFTSMCV